jgi:hypothetical protein
MARHLLAVVLVAGFAACSSEVSDRCQAADEVVATYELWTEPAVDLENAWMVESTDQTLESWYFVSAIVRGGEFDGQVATWQIPGFNGEIDPVNTPSLSIAAEVVSSSIYRGTQPLLEELDPEDYGVSDWSELEGFDASRECLGI